MTVHGGLFEFHAGSSCCQYNLCHLFSSPGSPCTAQEKFCQLAPHRLCAALEAIDPGWKQWILAESRDAYLRLRRHGRFTAKSHSRSCEAQPQRTTVGSEKRGQALTSQIGWSGYFNLPLRPLSPECREPPSYILSDSKVPRTLIIGWGLYFLPLALLRFGQSYNFLE